MGCTSSKQISASAVEAYRPPPSSFAVFDINAIEEPWIKQVDQASPNQDVTKSANNTTPQLPPPILAKITSFEDAVPRSWDEISKALQVLKPSATANAATITTAASAGKPKPATAQQPPPQNNGLVHADNNTVPRKSFSFHTIEELDAKLKPETMKPAGAGQESTESEPALKAPGFSCSEPPRASGVTDSSSFRPLRENVFILNDRQGKGKGRKTADMEKLRWDPLSGFPEKCPPGGANTVVLYTTSLRGVRRTFEDCNKARSVLETHRVVLDERDVALHGKFLSELRELLGEGEAAVALPRLFVKERYLGGVEEVVELNESGRLGRILSWARVERRVRAQGCEGCGGARFVPCLECGGSCKVLSGDRNEKERCAVCNENGLVLCPICH